MKKRFLGVLAIAGALAATAACAPNPDEAGPTDLEAPVILSVEVIPNEVTPGQPMTIRATVSDNEGVTDVAFLVGRNGTPSGFCSGAAARTGGTATLGTWELSCTAPEVLNAGTYLAGTMAVDGGLNVTTTAHDSPVAIRGEFTVLGDVDDSAAPVIESVTTSPAVVAPGGQITISAHVTDASGVANVGFAVRKDFTDTMDWCLEGATLASGTTTDGVWELTCQVGAGALPGSYRVNTAVADVLNNFGGVGDEGGDTVAGPFTVTAPAAG